MQGTTDDRDLFARLNYIDPGPHRPFNHINRAIRVFVRALSVFFSGQVNKNRICVIHSQF